MAHFSDLFDVNRNINILLRKFYLVIGIQDLFIKSCIICDAAQGISAIISQPRLYYQLKL
jgi:hypothetical protein